jgi:hypothetical protein
MFRGAVGAAAQDARDAGVTAALIVEDLRALADHIERVGASTALDGVRVATPPALGGYQPGPRRAQCADCGIEIRQTRKGTGGGLIWVTIGPRPRAICGLADDALHHPTAA